jgi:hypothetical protein
VLENDGEDQLDRLHEKGRRLQRVKEKEIFYTPQKKKEDHLDWSYLA